MSWTISRSLPDSDGGHFYNSKYGVRVKGGPDSVVIWDPSEWHGTSLQNYKPADEKVAKTKQTGLAIVTPSRIQGLWEGPEDPEAY